MSVTIYAYRTLIWISRQNRDDMPESLIPEAVLPVEERRFARDEMADQGWLVLDGETAMPDFGLSLQGRRQAQRWKAQYPVYSAAHEILQAIPQERDAYLLGGDEAFDSSYQDPVTGDAVSEETVDRAVDLLHRRQYVVGEEGHGVGLSRLELTQQGREIQGAQEVPGLVSGSSAGQGRAPVSYFNTQISDSNVGVAQVGHSNTSRVGSVGFGVDQHFRELRELTDSNASPDDREELLEQIQQLEEAAKRDDRAEFETLRNGFLSGFASKVGEKAVGALMAIGPALWG